MRKARGKPRAFFFANVRMRTQSRNAMRRCDHDALCCLPHMHHLAIAPRGMHDVRCFERRMRSSDAVLRMCAVTHCRAFGAADIPLKRPLRVSKTSMAIDIAKKNLRCLLTLRCHVISFRRAETICGKR